MWSTAGLPACHTETLLSVLRWNEGLLVAPSEPGWWALMPFPDEDNEPQAASLPSPKELWYSRPQTLLPPSLSETGSCAASTELSQDQLYPSRRASYPGGAEGHRCR